MTHHTINECSTVELHLAPGYRMSKNVTVKNRTIQSCRFDFCLLDIYVLKLFFSAVDLICACWNFCFKVVFQCCRFDFCLLTLMF